jgi:hypothetical protein
MRWDKAPRLTVDEERKNQQDGGYEQDNCNIRSQGPYYFEPFTHDDRMLPLKLLSSQLKSHPID